MNSKYLKYPPTVKALINEIKKICDDYINKEISEEVVKEFVDSWITHLGKNFYHDGEFNTTVKARIGAKRMMLLKTIIEDENI